MLEVRACAADAPVLTLNDGMIKLKGLISRRAAGTLRLLDFTHKVARRLTSEYLWDVLKELQDGLDRV